MKDCYGVLVAAMYELTPAEKDSVTESLTEEYVLLLHKAIDDLLGHEIETRMYIIVRSYYGIECDRKTLETIGLRLTVPVKGQTVSQVRQKALLQMRENIILRPLAQWLVELGCSSNLIQDTLLTPDAKQLASLSLCEQGVATGSFLFDCFPNCSPKDPCPTCRAKALLVEANIKDEIFALAQEWGEGPRNDWKSIILQGLPWTARTKNCFSNSHIVTLGQLIQLSRYELMRVPNMGNKSVVEIEEFLKTKGLSLATY